MRTDERKLKERQEAMRRYFFNNEALVHICQDLGRSGFWFYYCKHRF